MYLTPDYTDLSGWQQIIDLSIEGVNISLPDNLGQLTFSYLQSKVASNQRIRLAEVGQVISIRFCHNNPKCLPDYRQHSRPLKKVLQELNIAPWQRKRIPFLYYDDLLVAAIGHFVCQNYIPKNNESAITLTKS